jgi:hypothetical protein
VRFGSVAVVAGRQCAPAAPIARLRATSTSPLDDASARTAVPPGTRPCPFTVNPLLSQRTSLMRTHNISLVLLITAAAGASGCVPLSANSPIVQEKLKTVSAGYTGCATEDNVLSNIAAKPDGSGTWNVTCKGKTYLCSAVSTINKSESFHCAPAVQ